MRSVSSVKLVVPGEDSVVISTSFVSTPALVDLYNRYSWNPASSLAVQFNVSE